MARLDTTTVRRNVVAIGASAGGLHALSTVLPALPEDIPAAILIVQHLDPRYPSHMADILARRTKIRVVDPQDGEVVRESTIYVAPPDRHMLMEKDRVRLTTTELVHFVRPSVDLLFESVAAACGDRAVAVVLTGSGLDGAMGVRAIKETGGLVIVQDPVSAESTGMPTSAISTGIVDIVLPLEEIAEAIARAVMGGKEEDV